jgi:asparagine N-glycosylation enzyme membrane subunit Stt3
MEVLIWLWALTGVGHFVYDWFKGEDSLREAKDVLSTGNFIIEFVLNFVVFVLGGPVWFAYSLYKKWKDNQPFTP